MRALSIMLMLALCSFAIGAIYQYHCNLYGYNSLVDVVVGDIPKDTLSLDVEPAIDYDTVIHFENVLRGKSYIIYLPNDEEMVALNVQ